MDIWVVVLLVLAAIVVLLFVGGLIGNTRARSAHEKRLSARIADADQALAVARAEDRGWEKEALHAAARAAFEAQRPGVEIRRIELVQVVDKPGVEEDRAAFHVLTPDGEDHLELARTADGGWRAA